jgi:hypothetical protein
MNAIDAIQDHNMSTWRAWSDALRVTCGLPAIFDCKLARGAA